MTYIVPNYFIERNYKNLIKIDTLFCLNYITKTQNDFVDARNTMHSMNILLEGSKIIHTKNQEIRINDKELCFLTQNNYYMSERVTKESQYKSMILYFDDAFILIFIKKYNIELNNTDEKTILKISCRHDQFLLDNITLFQAYLEKKLTPQLLKLKIEEMFLHTMRLRPQEFQSFLNTIIQKTQERTLYILESNINLIETIDDMCSLSHLTPNKLRRYIKKHTNTTPKLWIDSKRLQKAILLLKTSNKNISEIATECGYATPSWFIYQFKKEYGETPKEFRKIKF